MTTVATRPDGHESASLAIDALNAAEPALPPFAADETSRQMAAYDLAACIRSALPMLTSAERRAFAAALWAGGDL